MSWKFCQDRTWSALIERYHWVAAMQGVEQDPLFHAEGDVAEHTQRVLMALQQLPEYHQLAPLEQEIVWTAALMHDIEKPSTTSRDATGRIHSPNHAKRGEFTARSVLYRDISTPFYIRESIASLVRHHGVPLWFLEKNDIQKTLLQLSYRVNTQLLSILAKADVLGRESLEQQEFLDRIALFEAECQALQCWRYSRQFSSPEAKICYFTSGEYPDYQPYEQSACQVVVLCGLPGMGKDYYLSYEYVNWPIVSLDDIRRQYKIKPEDKQANGWVVQQVKAQAKNYLRQHCSFVWNATNITRQTRKQIIDLCLAYQANVTLVYLEVPFQIWRKQNSEREHQVPEKALDRMLMRLEPPTEDEAHQVIYQLK